MTSRTAFNFGPLDAKTRTLVDLGIGVGMHARWIVRKCIQRALEQGISVAELEQAIWCGANFLEFQRVNDALQWLREELQNENESGRGCGY